MAFKAELLRAQSTLQAGRLKTNSSALSPTFDMTLFCQIWLMAFFQILFIFSMIEYSFYRNTRGNLNFGKFKRDRIHYLWEEKLASLWWKINWTALSFVMVNQSVIHSTWQRILTQEVIILSCPDSSGLHLCEFLAIDKYSVTEKLQGNNSFYHFSLAVRKQ